MSWGYVAKRHGRKVHPWVARLNQAARGLQEDVRAGNRAEVVRSIEDVAFWQGRVICDLLGAEDYPTGVSQRALVSTFARAQIALGLGRRFLTAA